MSLARADHRAPARKKQKKFLQTGTCPQKSPSDCTPSTSASLNEVFQGPPDARRPPWRTHRSTRTRCVLAVTIYIIDSFLPSFFLSFLLSFSSFIFFLLAIVYRFVPLAGFHYSFGSSAAAGVASRRFCGPSALPAVLAARRPLFSSSSSSSSFFPSFVFLFVVGVAPLL